MKAEEGKAEERVVSELWGGREEGREVGKNKGKEGGRRKEKEEMKGRGEGKARDERGVASFFNCRLARVAAEYVGAPVARLRRERARSERVRTVGEAGGKGGELGREGKEGEVKSTAPLDVRATLGAASSKAIAAREKNRVVEKSILKGWVGEWMEGGGDDTEGFRSSAKAKVAFRSLSLS